MRRLRRMTAAILTAAVLGACNPGDDATPKAVVSTKPLPPYPAWSSGMVGKNLARVLTGHGQCKGVWDVVTDRYVGARPGVQVGGWGWDIVAKTPVQHVLFVNSDDFIVGAGTGGLPRKDVSDALPEVKSPNTGWKGVIGVSRGKVLAVGVTAQNTPCNVGVFDLDANAT